MKWLLATTVIAATLAVLAGTPAGKRKKFEGQVFSPTVISPSGIDETRFSSMTGEARLDVISAKKVLADFFKACHVPGVDPRRYLSTRLAKKYRDGDALRHALFDPETELVFFLISDFLVLPENRIDLKYAAVLFSEGSFVVREDRAAFEKEAGQWRISAMGSLH